MSAATQVIVPDIDPAERGRATGLVDIANDYVIDSPEVRAFADKDLAAAKSQRAHLEKMRTDIKAPIIEAGKKVDALFKPMIEFCDTAIGVYTQKILGFDRQVAAARAAEQQQAEAAATAAREKLQAQAKSLVAAGATEAE